MPWCDSCDVYLAPNTVKTEGTCPTCDGQVDASDMDAAALPVPKVPWHFWVVVVALVAYLLWRVVDIINWVIEFY